MAPQREWFEKDYYKILGVSTTASEKEVTRAYRRLAKQYHPDAHPGSEERFKEVAAAYDVLGDAAKRKEYDEVRAMGPMAAGPFGGPGASGAPGGGFGFKVEDLSDLFGGIFNRGTRSSGRGSGPQRGTDMEAELHLSFEDAVRGVTTTVNVTGDAPCRTCGGSGAAPGTSPTVCARCGGRGVLDENQGLFSFSQPCPVCAGRGLLIDRPCPTCRASGVEHRPRQVKARIPAGVESGQRIRLKGRGGAGRNGGPAGDLFVVVRVGHHERFGRKGRDLTVTVPVSFPEAVLGTTVDVPTLDGTVPVKVAPGTPPGRVLRVRGRGVPADGRKAAGDLLATVSVTVPASLTEEQLEAVEHLAEVIPPTGRIEGTAAHRARS